MTCYFRSVPGVPTKVVIASLEQYSFLDKHDACRVVRVGCFQCGKAFLEELCVARGKVIHRLPFECLSCDPEADEPVQRRMFDRREWWLG